MIEERIDMISKIALAHSDLETLILLKDIVKLLPKLRENEKMLREVRKSERQLVEAFFAEKDKPNGNG